MTQRTSPFQNTSDYEIRTVDGVTHLYFLTNRVYQLPIKLHTTSGGDENVLASTLITSTRFVTDVTKSGGQMTKSLIGISKSTSSAKPNSTGLN